RCTTPKSTSAVTANWRSLFARVFANLIKPCCSRHRSTGRRYRSSATIFPPWTMKYCACFSHGERWMFRRHRRLRRITMKVFLRFARAMGCAVLAACSVLIGGGPALAAPKQDKDYLSSIEADKIRDAETTNERIVLFLNFAEDRLKKFQYELEHPSANKHEDMLNFLMNAYSGCLDDAADLVQ